MNTFVGVKQQASGWPPGCDSEEQKQAYLDAFELAEGIRLIYEMVEKNPGLRLIAVCFERGKNAHILFRNCY